MDGDTNTQRNDDAMHRYPRTMSSPIQKSVIANANRREKLGRRKNGTATETQSIIAGNIVLSRPGMTVAAAGLSARSGNGIEETGIASSRRRWTRTIGSRNRPRRRCSLLHLPRSSPGTYLRPFSLRHRPLLLLLPRCLSPLKTTPMMKWGHSLS